MIRKFIVLTVATLLAYASCGDNDLPSTDGGAAAVRPIGGHPVDAAGNYTANATSFTVFVLGAAGGPVESRVSGYLIHPANSSNMLGFDCGSLMSGLRQAAKVVSSTAPFNALKGKLSSRDIHRNVISGYLVSHAHIDHMSGLIIASADERASNKTAGILPKAILGLNSTLVNIHNHAFNNQLWPDLALFGFYFYQQLIPGSVAHNVSGIQGLDAIAFPVSHGSNYLSTCFLLGTNLSNLEAAEGSAILLCGDLGTDANEKSVYMNDMWTAVAPLVASSRLKAIMIECSFPTATSTGALFGHLTPALLFQELHTLAKKVGSDNALKGMKVLIQHIKENDVDDDTGVSASVGVVAQELESLNDVGVDLIFTHEKVGGAISV
ncbi:cyclic-AMP phosphodiesterase [Chytriomyces cf. hyalinus JEL632]|nr:cyclic-AMP phosphodiesterase [Chytriomyces cf. hyalinus JEL632]